MYDTRGSAAAILVTVSSFAGCTAILGDFNSGSVDGDAGDAASQLDSGLDSDRGAADGSAPTKDAASESTPPADSSLSTDSGVSVDSSGFDSGPDATMQDSGSDAGDPCTSPPKNAVYVNASTGSNSNTGGAPNCALATITAALAASSTAVYDNSTIYVAEGTYGAGETFPLVINQGRSLIGAGASTTIIQGSSSSYNTVSTESFLDTGTNYITLLAGDPLTDGGFAPITISGFTIRPASTLTAPTADYYGLVCIAGNGPDVPAKPPFPPANLIVDRMEFGPNFDDGMTIGSQPIQEIACNVLVTGSAFNGNNVGVATGECGGANPAISWPSAQIGDGSSTDKNTFSENAIDLYANGCGGAESIDTNTFQGGYRGVVAIALPTQYLEILNNAFVGGTTDFPMGIGVQVGDTVNVTKLNGNSFTNISESAAADTSAGETTGYALIVSGGILQAHTNFVSGNDNGLEIAGAPDNFFDFSSDGVPTNANQIYCNSKGTGQAGAGYDVILSYTNSGGNVANLAGNVFDHAPPSTSVSLTTSPNGTDLVTGTSLGATTTGSQSIGPFVCGNGRVQ